MAAVPGVDDYLREAAIHGRIETIGHQLAAAGLVVSEAGLADLADVGELDQYVGHALRAAVHIMDGDAHGSSEYLSRFWGRLQDRALGHIFREGGLLEDAGPLTESASKLCERLAAQSTFASAVACANIIHHLARRSDPVLDGLTPSTRSQALIYRSRTIGEIIRTNSRICSIP